MLARAPKSKMKDYQWQDRVKERMIEIGVTQSELANQLGITQGAVSSILNGNTDPKLETFCAMCQALSLSADWLLFDELKPKSSDNISKSAYKVALAWQRLPHNYKRDIERAIDILTLK